ncbi:MAG: GNAT family N-acetyltransferase [Candidatus Hodarchaeota archaeon]
MLNDGYIFLEGELQRANQKIHRKISDLSWKKLSLLRVDKLNWLDDEQVRLFVECYNRTFLVAPDPFRPILPEEAVAIANDAITFVAYLYGRMVGFIVCYMTEEEPSCGYIAGIGTIPERRKVGVATVLILRAIEWFLAQGALRLRCEVHEDNTISFKLFESHGFKPVDSGISSRDSVSSYVSA